MTNVCIELRDTERLKPTARPQKVRHRKTQRQQDDHDDDDKDDDDESNP